MNQVAFDQEPTENYDDLTQEDDRTIEDRSTDIEEKSAMDRMFDYMNSHNYRLDYKDTYMSDLEWISINQDL